MKNKEHLLDFLTDQLDILADDSVTVTSVNGDIEVKANQKIVLQADGASITLACIHSGGWMSQKVLQKIGDTIADRFLR